MELQIIEQRKLLIAEFVSAQRVINTPQDALDAMGNADYNGARSIIFYEHQLHPDFFNLSSGLAGEILQKFSNYHMKLAIVGEFRYDSKPLQAFIIECNRGKHVFFVPSRDQAIQKLSA